MSLFTRIAEEPPFRLLGYFLVRRFVHSVATINRWSAVNRPHYLAGVYTAAQFAKAEGIMEISVIEAGVADGNGLIELQEYAELVETQTGIGIKVFGFDTGEGLPILCGDYRDHPDQWRLSDYRMDVSKLQAQLKKRTHLYLGDIIQTQSNFVADNHPPIGFVACDVDLYSSTVSVLKLLTTPARKLRRVFMYFDDINFVFNHRFAGELLAIEEFNRNNLLLKIDRWRDIRKNRVFRDESWLDNMFILHDLDAINKYTTSRATHTYCDLVN